MDTSDLPLPDYDHLALGDLTTRIRSLAAPQVEALLDFERAHGDRVPVVQVLSARMDQLAGGAQPSGGDATAADPLAPPAPAGGSAVDPSTQGPKVNPPSHGDPTNFTRQG